MGTNTKLTTIGRDPKNNKGFINPGIYKGSTIIFDDNDCDGVNTNEDCDDNESSLTMISEDGDCDGVLTTGEKMKPPTAAQKKAAAAHQAKVDAENAAERAKDPSQGRYPKG